MQVVLLQEGADLDALSSAYGLTLLNKRLKIVLPNSVSTSVSTTLSMFKHCFQDRTLKKQEFDLTKVKRLFLTDSHHIPEGYTGRVVIFDHHPANLNQQNIKAYIHNTGAATTIIVELLKKRKKNLTPDDATILALGIYEDTGSLKFSSTTIRDIRAVEYLIKSGMDFERLRAVVEDRFDTEDLGVMLSLSENLSILQKENTKVGITYFNDRYSKDISRLIKYIKEFQQVDAVFVVVGQKNKVSIIARSKNTRIDTAKVLSNFEGGGHWYAASAKVKGFSVREVLEILKFILLEKKSRVRDIAEKNVPVLYADDTAEKYSLLPHFPVYVVVDRQGKYQGVVTERVLKELVKHGFGNQEVRSYLTDIITVSPDDYLFSLLKTLKKTSQEIFPVVENGFFHGVITRGMILGSLFKQQIQPQIKLKPKKKNINVLLNRFFPGEVLQELVSIGKLSAEIGYRVFLVGGVVRDIIMGKQNLDIDLVVEGDATVLLSEYARRKGYSYFYYPEFLTGYIKTFSGIKIDFATARREIYEYPGAYPKIERASVEEDLLRRDFTINSLIVEITEGSFGTLLDYFGGLTDIKEKRIKVLHPVSFIEDPIRILRALRFAGRLGFKLQKDTENLLINAVKNDILPYAPAGRIKLELELTFNEEKVLDIIQLMERYGVLKSVLELEKLTPLMLQKLQKARDTISMFRQLFSVEPSKTFVYLMVILSTKPIEEAYVLLKKFHFEREAKHIEKVFSYVSALKEVDRMDVLLNLTKEHVDIITCVSVLSEDAVSERITGVYTKLKNPVVTGEDLIKLGLKPSSLFRHILQDINLKHISGELKTKEDCIKYIQTHYLKQERP